MNESSVLRGALNNLATQVVSCRPWEFCPKIPPQVLASKATYTTWRALPQTEHLIITGWEGINSGIRINKGNNPKRLHALIADYDTKITDAEFNSVLDRAPADLRPTWIARTYSGGARLVWMFAQPLPMELNDITKPFLRVAMNMLSLGKIFPSFDDKAFLDVSKLYDVGHSWKKLGDYTLSSNMLHYWLTEAAKKTNFSSDEVRVPIEEVAAEVERRWPGRWPGEFKVGNRGPAFFDDLSTNPTAAIITENGMICFSKERLFYSWASILGNDFIKRFQADKVGAAVSDVWFTGSMYYRKIDHQWVHIAKEDFVKHLAVDKQLDPVRHESELASETTIAEMFVQNNRRIHGIKPYHYDPRDVVYEDGQKFLNVSYVKAMQPAETYADWGTNFPWIANFLDTFFAPTSQLDFWTAWTQRLYRSALSGKLKRGQNVFLVGPLGIGKTLLAHRIIGDLMGGSADASQHVIKGSEFNKKLGEMAIWTIDDGEVASNPAAHRKFGEMVKKLAANPTMNFRKMFHDAETIRWAGRLIVTLNNDVLSMQLLPDLSQSLEDKVLIFNVADIPRKFPSDVEDIIARELPHYARAVLEWTPPAHVIGEERFGVARYVQEDVRSAAMYSGQTGDFLELVAMWIKITQPEGPQWAGNASEWYASVASNDTLRMLITKSTPRAIGVRFSEASRIRDTGVTLLREDQKKGNIYAIDVSSSGKDKRGAVRFTPDFET